jgi:hypothetical protein
MRGEGKREAQLFVDHEEVKLWTYHFLSPSRSLFIAI